MDKKQLLIIGTVWPEPTSSAAGTRMVQLVDSFLQKGFEVCFASAATKGEYSFDLPGLGVVEQQIKLNDSGFNDFVKELDPGMVLYDRYMIEEQYGWRIRQECPDCCQVLDTEDLHFLRQARQLFVKSGRKTLEDLNLYTDLAKREIASILRCDLSLIISEVEMNMLKDQFRIDPSLIYHLPFLEQKITREVASSWKTFEQREGFVFIGNFLHEPNWNTLQVLKTQVWPVLRKRLPKVTMNIYGAYPSQKVLELNNIKEKFYVKGRAKDAIESLSLHKVLLAPIQFGAGVKGKLIDAMRAGTPSVTTTTGAEGMKGNLDWSGIIEDDVLLFVEEAVKLYEDKILWSKYQQNGIHIVNVQFEALKSIDPFFETLDALTLNLKAHRKNNFFGQILQHNHANSTKYMSLWIEEKNSGKGIQ
jgi:glycosyltransferase involved in cell wall biosynthesis